VAALTARDTGRLLRFVAEAEDLGRDEAFTPAVLEELGKLVPADAVTYCELDRVRQRFRHAVDRSGDGGDVALPVPYWEIEAEHPICRRHEFGALKLSDFLSRKQLRRSRIYAVWFRPLGIEHELDVAIASPPWHTKTFLFNRFRGRDFTERDRLVLDLLQPHFGRLWRAAQTRRRLRAAITGLERASKQDARGVVLLASDGRIEFASPPARRLILEYFGASPEAELPAALSHWLESGSPTLACRLADCRLTIERSGDALLLEETRDELGLTPRERDILAWVARGNTNPEIAEILWIAPATVRKHLENVYAKLGVRTRTAAVTRFLGFLHDEEGQGSTPA
jgi:DNA-binding CsgD family transcriptional regulator